MLLVHRGFCSINMLISNSIIIKIISKRMIKKIRCLKKLRNVGLGVTVHTKKVYYFSQFGFSPTIVYK